MTETLTLRPACAADAAAIHRLISENLEAGHLLPRTLADVENHASRFVVADADGTVIGCAELAPLSRTVAEVRSLVVNHGARGQGIGTRLVQEIGAAASAGSFDTLCAFTHEPSHFVRMGFTLVPHIWVPEKIAHDCTSCALFRRCGQYAVLLPLRSGVSVRPERPAALVQSIRAAAPRRPNIERLQLRPASEREREPEAVPA